MGHADSKELNHSVKGNDETSEDLEVEKMKGGGGGVVLASQRLGNPHWG